GVDWPNNRRNLGQHDQAVGMPDCIDFDPVLIVAGDGLILLGGRGV
ncbi:MAG: hypothetical protein RL717_2785, partial [Pseudomonadota bacterium]